MIKATNESMRRPEHIPALTGIRFFAAISVVFYHYWEFFLPPERFGRPFGSGFMGVSLFFVLSGFVMALSYIPDSGAELEKTRFYIARFARIYPAYIVSLLLQIPILAWHIAGAARVFRETLIALGSFAANLVLLQAWWRRLDWRWNAPSWSLCAEAFFYLLFPYAALKLRGRRFRIHTLLLSVFGCWLLMIAPCLLVLRHGVGWNEQPRPEIFSFVAFAPIFRIPEFMIGVCLALMYKRARSEERSQGRAKHFGSVALYSGCLLTLAILGAGAQVPFLLRYNGIADLGFAALIFGLASSRAVLVKLLSAPVLVLLGEASYSIYILQTPIMDYFTLVIRRPSSSGTVDGVLWFSVYVVLLIVASVLCFKWIESPLRRMINNRVKAAKARNEVIQSRITQLETQA